MNLLTVPIDDIDDCVSVIRNKKNPSDIRRNIAKFIISSYSVA